MTINSERVKKWRVTSKIKMIEAMGGCCQICKYNKCNNAMEFHHVDSKEKEFSFGKIRGNAINWSKICDELEKCVMLCANCHREIHAGLATLPESFRGFDQSYRNYKFQYSEKYRKPPSRKFDWSKTNIDDLLANKTLSYVKIAKIVGVSDNTVRSYAKKNYLR